MFKADLPYITPAELYNITEIKTVKGVDVPVYSETGDLFFCSFKSFGGTESVVNDVLTIIDTANVETWFRPDIKASSRIKINGNMYEVMGEPENISMRNQFLKFKVRGVKGGT